MRTSYTCPLCKETLTTNDLFVTVQEDFVPNHQHLPLKLEMFQQCLNQIMSRQSFKLLVFSEYDAVFNEICPILNDIDVKFGYLKGNSINNIVHQYKHMNLNVLLVNPTAYGSGLNLENTTDIIIYHKFQESLDKQVIGRAQRPGRTHPLNVWYILNENE
jgi:SNF2 family DNA or RNA helicase